MDLHQYSTSHVQTKHHADLRLQSTRNGLRILAIITLASSSGVALGKVLELTLSLELGFVANSRVADGSESSELDGFLEG